MLIPSYSFYVKWHIYNKNECADVDFLNFKYIVLKRLEIADNSSLQVK